MKKFLLGTALLWMLFSPRQSSAQQGEIDNFANDMLLLADKFASPAAQGAAYSSSGGWFVSARSLDPWQVDFSVHANVLFVPESKRNLTVSGSEFQTFNIRGAETATIPSAFGEQTNVVFEGSLFGQSFQFDAIDGVEKQVLAHPFVQAAVGLPMGTDLVVRFSPQVAVDDVRFSTLGVGLKHNINQYFLDSGPTDFQFAALVSYSKYDVNYAFNPVVVDYDLLGQTFLIAQMEDIEVDADFWLLQLVSSKGFANSNWEVFGALGATNSSFGYVLGGRGEALGQINRALETLSNSEMEVKGDLGFNYKAGDFLISSMFSVGKFLNYNLSLHYRL